MRQSSRDLTIAAKPSASISAIAGPVACHMTGQPKRAHQQDQPDGQPRLAATIIARLIIMLRWRAT